ncbi:MAG TPA: DUF4136 domain-containing protein [Gemmatimonadaceae bacterium]|nr:DUF4136 domain-containing protein [Gemmatimonadaceae bacterium]
MPRRRVQLGDGEHRLRPRRRLRHLEEQLRAKGLTRVKSGGDLVATHHAAVENEIDITTTGGGIYGPRWGGGPTTTQVRNVPVGTLLVDLLDSAGTRLVWRGRANGTLSSDPEKSQQQINEAVAEMFQQYPPKQ